MHIKIRDWEIHFEKDRTKQWKHIKWVPVPNKQGIGYKLIMEQKNGLEIFACWIALLEQASLCEPRGDLSKYNLKDLSILTLIKKEPLNRAILFLSQQLDWIIVIENLDVCVKKIDVDSRREADDSSILSNSILSNLKEEDTKEREFESFWKAYPKKTGKAKAKEAWDKNEPPLEQCLKTIEWQKKSDQWKREKGLYIPMPVTWINQERWNDEPVEIERDKNEQLQGESLFR